MKNYVQEIINSQKIVIVNQKTTKNIAGNQEGHMYLWISKAKKLFVHLNWKIKQRVQDNTIGPFEKKRKKRNPTF